MADNQGSSNTQTNAQDQTPNAAGGQAQSQADDGGMGLENFQSAPSNKGDGDTSKETPATDPISQQAAQKEAVYDIPVKITAVIGSATMPVSQLIRLGRGAVVQLDRKLGEAVDIYANNRLIALGEVVVVDDNHIGVTMTEILSSSASSSNDTDS